MNAGFVIRFERGTIQRADLAGCYLGWTSGMFIPLIHRETASKYDKRHVACTVASRAQRAYPGARFEVELVAL